MRKIKSLAIGLVCVCLLGVVGACNVDKEKKVDPNIEVDFKTTEQSKMFFNNVRKLSYDIEEDKNTDRLFYRINERITDDDQLLLNLCIVQDPKIDAVYLMLEPSKKIDVTKGIKLKWESNDGKSEGIYEYEQGNVHEQFSFLTEIYNGLIEQRSFYFVEDGQEIPILDAENEREAFRKTMMDYYRLVNIF
ncbi:hypothetical protein V6R21_22895 [Limibacter armeniacum]|uniref:hypothetical protein n=1 Tax=Limibacter armeniacum TaxID=466084 RepID=UPI002FE695A2